MDHATLSKPAAPAAAARNFKVRGMHHHAYKCKDPVATRHFYEDVLGMPLEHIVRATHVPTTGGAPVHYFHMFFRMGDGSYMAFFDLGDNEAAAPSPNTDRWINHIALEVESYDQLVAIKKRLEEEGVQSVGPLDHDFIKSIYLFDPDDIRLEFTVRTPESDGHVYGHTRKPDEEFKLWLKERSRAKEFAESWKVAQRE
jgi:catechol 2,3-dioxygenase-like lactoylglutathione lyase family enzyme